MPTGEQDPSNEAQRQRAGVESHRGVQVTPALALVGKRKASEARTEKPHSDTGRG